MSDEELKKLVEAYQPSVETEAAMSRVRLVATVGPSATGKSTIMKALAESDDKVHFVVGETSRRPRQGEVDGVDLYFRSRNDIIEDLKAGRLTQIVFGPNGDLYCTHIDNFPPGKTCVFPLVPQGVRQFRALPLAFFEAAFIVPADFELWQQWFRRQAEISGWSEEKINGRLKEAIASHEFALNDPNMHFVLNDDVKMAARRLHQVTKSENPDDESTAKKIAELNLDKLKGIIVS